jgi:hypothetical protein
MESGPKTLVPDPPQQQETGAPEPATLLPGTMFRIALIVALLADALQLAVFPLFVEGAESPAEDALDLGIGAVLVWLLGWHWEFAPSFLAKLVPGVDLVPFWTLAVANVYRKKKQLAVAAQDSEQHNEG